CGTKPDCQQKQHSFFACVYRFSTATEQLSTDSVNEEKKCLVKSGKVIDFCIPAEYNLYSGCIQNVFRLYTNCIQAEYKLYTAGIRSVYSFDTPAA
ncbi:MAG: hypothetical protein IJT53_05545, partial [Prevotella sp.]|nr:hypothetical protein [Prevotella sp.]